MVFLKSRIQSWSKISARVTFHGLLVEFGILPVRVQNDIESIYRLRALLIPIRILKQGLWAVFNCIIARFCSLVAQAVRVIRSLFWLRNYLARRCIHLCTLDGLFFYYREHVARGRLRILTSEKRISFLVIEIRQTLHTRGGTYSGLKFNFFSLVLCLVQFICGN